MHKFEINGCKAGYNNKIFFKHETIPIIFLSAKHLGRKNQFLNNSNKLAEKNNNIFSFNLLGFFFFYLQNKQYKHNFIHKIYNL